MSAAPRVILLDSNAYFRLARSIHPLLAGTFGPPPYSLFVLADLDDEYASSARLRNKFEWVNESPYRNDRSKKRFECRGKWASQVQTAFSFLAAYVKNQGLDLAKEDLKALAVGIARNLPVVSDDGGMRHVAEAHGIECWRVLDLLRLMVECNRTTVETVRQILDYLVQDNDLPMSKTAIRAFYAQHFGADCPI